MHSHYPGLFLFVKIFQDFSLIIHSLLPKLSELPDSEDNKNTDSDHSEPAPAVLPGGGFCNSMYFLPQKVVWTSLPETDYNVDIASKFPEVLCPFHHHSPIIPVSAHIQHNICFLHLQLSEYNQPQFPKTCKKICFLS